MRGFLFAIGVFCVALPGAADAYCVINDASKQMRVKLASYNPLGKWYRLVRPGERVCCDWFDHRCNPGTSQHGLVYLTVRSKSRNPLYCSHNIQKQVKVTGGGTVTISEDSTKPGGLRCKSVDLMMREVSAPNYKPLGRKRPGIIVPPQSQPRIDEVDETLPGENTKSGVPVDSDGNPVEPAP